MAKNYFYDYTNSFLHRVLLITIILFSANQVSIQDGDSVDINALSDTHVWDRLLIEEVPSLRENVDRSISALNEANYSKVREQIEDIKSGDNWFNIKKELEARNAINLVSHFNHSLYELDGFVRTEDSVTAARTAHILSASLDDIVLELSEPVLDTKRLILTTSIIGIVIGSGLYIIPKFRKKLNIKY
jgi:hypothetical protein